VIEVIVTNLCREGCQCLELRISDINFTKFIKYTNHLRDWTLSLCHYWDIARHRDTGTWRNVGCLPCLATRLSVSIYNYKWPKRKESVAHFRKSNSITCCL